MRKEFIISMVCAFSIIFYSCKENVNKSEINSDGVKTITLSSIEESLLDTSYFKKPEIVVLQTTEESLITEITRIAMDDNTLFIYDKLSHKLFIFDINGKYINKIDYKGSGPKEYVETNDFAIDTSTKQIILLCATPEKLMYFTYKGEFIKEENSPCYFSRIATDGKYIYFEESSGDRNNQLYILNTETRKQSEVLKTLDIKNYLFVKGNSLSQSKSILFVRRYDNSIYELKNGEIIEKYRVDFKEHTFPQWFLTEEESRTIMDEYRKNEYIFSMVSISENDNYIIFHTNIGPCIYDKRKKILNGYKRIKSPRYQPIMEYYFTSYLPVQHTNMIACIIEEPTFLEHTKHTIKHYNQEKIKEMQIKYPGALEELVSIGEKIIADNNPVLFIYEFKN